MANQVTLHAVVNGVENTTIIDGFEGEWGKLPEHEKRVSYHEQFSHKKRDFHWETAMEYPDGTFTKEEVVKLVKDQRVLAEKPMRVIKVTTIIEEIEVFK